MKRFLRRIQYKMLLRGPSVGEFTRIFENFCAARRLACPRTMVQNFIERRYKSTNKPMRRCHPRDVITHVLHLIHFERLATELTPELLDRAFDSCFLEERPEEVVPETVMLPAPAAPVCGPFWGDKLAQIHTAFGTLAFVAGFRDRATGVYMNEESERLFGAAETTRVLQRLHAQAFREWSDLNAGQKSRDLSRYMATDREASRANLEQSEWVNRLIPAGMRPEDSVLFVQDFGAVMASLFPRPTATTAYEREPLSIPQQKPLVRSA